MSPSLTHGRSEDRDDLVLPHVDFSKATRGAYAHRMGENAEDEQKVAIYWQELGFVVEALESGKDPSSRQPDLLLLRNGKPVAYCEVKTIQRHRRQIFIFQEGHNPEDRVELSSKKVDGRGRGRLQSMEIDLVTAIRQLNYANPDHSLRNFVVLVNRDPEATPALIGGLFSRRPLSSLRRLQAKRGSRTAEAIQDFRHKVDLFLWADGISGFSVTGYFVSEPSLREKMAGLAGLGLEKLRPLEPAA